MALTIKGIEAAKPKFDKASGKYKLVRLADGSGLFLEVTEKSKRWRTRYFFEGKEQMLSLGIFPVVGLKEARDKNFLLRQQIDQGINPALERKKEKGLIKEAILEEKRIAKGEAHPMSLEAVALDWLEDVRKTGSKAPIMVKRSVSSKISSAPLGNCPLMRSNPLMCGRCSNSLKPKANSTPCAKLPRITSTSARAFGGRIRDTKTAP